MNVLGVLILIFILVWMVAIMSSLLLVNKALDNIEKEIKRVADQLIIIASIKHNRSL